MSPQTQVWATLRFTSNVGLSNSASHFKRGSEQLCVSVSTHACGLHVLTSMQPWEDCKYRVYTTAWDLHLPRDPHLCCDWPLLLSQLTPHIMWELIFIMVGFYETIIPLRPPINSLKSNEQRGPFFWDFEQRILKLKASLFSTTEVQREREKRRNK